MSIQSNDYIAGRKRVSDWQAISKSLAGSGKQVWRGVFNDYFRQRLELRYLHPIRLLQEHSTFQGEGFSIVAIQCSLIEFLESTTQGINYRFLRRGETLAQYEYASSKNIFVEFLSRRLPFSKSFSEQAAFDFYQNVRCGLLHEARTKNGWRIWAEDANRVVADVTRKVVYRDNFQQALLDYIEAYGEALVSSAVLQEAFIRKFDSLCQQ